MSIEGNELRVGTALIRVNSAVFLRYKPLHYCACYLALPTHECLLSTILPDNLILRHKGDRGDWQGVLWIQVEGGS